MAAARLMAAASERTPQPKAEIPLEVKLELVEEMTATRCKCWVLAASLRGEDGGAHRGGRIALAKAKAGAQGGAKAGRIALAKAAGAS